jgi:hypothetical protein
MAAAQKDANRARIQLRPLGELANTQLKSWRMQSITATAESIRFFRR